MDQYPPPHLKPLGAFPLSHPSVLKLSYFCFGGIELSSVVKSFSPAIEESE